MNAINERLLQLRKALNKTQDEFGKEVGVSRSVIKNLEYNLTEPKPQFIELICKTYGVSRIWLETGEGEMFEPQTQDEELAAAFGELIGDPDDSFKKRFIKAMLDLDESAWGEVERFCLKLVAENEKKEDG